MCQLKCLSLYNCHCLCRSLEISCSMDALCQRHLQYFDESFRLAVEQRLVHEHDGKPPPPQLSVNCETLVPQSSCSIFMYSYTRLKIVE